MWNNQGYTIWGASSSKSNTVLCRRRERNESSLNRHSWTCKLLSWCIRYTRALEANQFYVPLASGLALRNCKNYIWMKCRSNPMGNSGLRSHPVRSLIFDIVFPTDMAPSKQMHKIPSHLCSCNIVVYFILSSREHDTRCMTANYGIVTLAPKQTATKWTNKTQLEARPTSTPTSRQSRVHAAWHDAPALAQI